MKPSLPARCWRCGCTAALLTLAACAQSATPSPGPLTGSMGGAVDRVLWVFGGEGPDGYSREVWSTDLSDLRWERHPDMPDVRSGGTAAWDGEGAFVVVGGCQTDDCDPVVRFDVEAQSWTPLAGAPGNRLQPGVHFVASKLWLFGGVDPASDTPLSDIWSYDAGWTSLGDALDLPTPGGGKSPVVSGATWAGGTSGAVTVSGGWMASWADGVLQSAAQSASVGESPDCVWVNDDSVFVWSAGVVLECDALSSYCAADEPGARPSVPGTACASVDATLWTYGGGVIDDGTVNEELWRYHDAVWTRTMDGGSVL